MAEQAFYVYLLRCEDGSLYAGMTSDPERRLRQHASKMPGGAKYTRMKRPVGFSAVWQAPDRAAALRLEAQLKRLTHAQKEALCASGETLFREEVAYPFRGDLRTEHSLLY